MKVEIFPRDVDLSKYVDSVEVDVDNFEDYHEMRKELRKLQISALRSLS
jgi:2-hydroxy-3-keto-5-methylthiopentenyl-1-phosphate phosphatase